MSRVWAMPSHETFSIKPIADFVRRHIKGVSVDPYARNSVFATWRNDLNPNTSAEYHMDAEQFLLMLREKEVKADCVIVDPPYSPRQVKECYDSIGHKMEQKDAMLGFIRRKVKYAIDDILKEDGVVLHFGWNTVGMGIKRGYEPVEIMLVCHGSDHNDTICLAEKRVGQQKRLPV